VLLAVDHEGECVERMSGAFGAMAAWFPTASMGEHQGAGESVNGNAEPRQEPAFAALQGGGLGPYGRVGVGHLMVIIQSDSSSDKPQPKCFIEPEVTTSEQARDYTLRELPMKRKTAQSSKLKGTPGERQFYAEAEYADSIFRDALGDSEGSIVALKRALEAMPTYAPAILSMGSVLYQAGRIAEGRVSFQSLLSLPKRTTDIRQIIDEAGTFLTRFEAYEDGMALYRTAVERYPDDPALFQGLGYCASNAGLYEEAVSANRRALELEPENQKLVNDLGWSLLQAGRLPEARETLERAISMDPSDDLARENLRFCRQQDRRPQNG